MNTRLIRNALLINEGQEFTADVLIENGRITRIEKGGINNWNGDAIDATGLWLIPGAIDDQVHFREPGLTHKADIASESRAAAAGGVTSFMEMPNVKPPSVSIELLEEKYAIAARNATVNYSFYMGTTNENYDELMRVDPETVCGIKIFMGSSTGNMLVDNHAVLERIFAHTPMLISTHCEDEARILQRTAEWTAR
ncbi:MAG: dihydroorotase, partial [Bacteroidota bacterium]